VTGEFLTTEHTNIACYDKILLELKAVAALCEAHEAQLHNYLGATGM
jgi:GxxExxY protein